MRVAFSALFQVNPDESISPLRPVHIDGVEMGPGVAFGAGLSLGSIDLNAIRGRDLEVEAKGGVMFIKSHYK